MAGSWQARPSANLEAKDWSYEFGITLGAARANLDKEAFAKATEADRLKMLYEEVEFMLTAKSHPNFIALFNKYWPNRPRLGATPSAQNDKIRILS